MSVGDKAGIWNSGYLEITFSSAPNYKSLIFHLLCPPTANKLQVFLFRVHGHQMQKRQHCGEGASRAELEILKPVSAYDSSFEPESLSGAITAEI